MNKTRRHSNCPYVNKNKLTVDVGEEEQPLRLAQRRDLRGECVVIAEPELLHRDAVVLVHDGYDSHVEERVERVSRPNVLLAVGEIFKGEEYLRALDADGVEDVLVVSHQVHLADRG